MYWELAVMAIPMGVPPMGVLHKGLHRLAMIAPSEVQI